MQITHINQARISEVKDLADKAHSHFFDDDTMRFFKSRISETCYRVGDMYYFITSEKGPNMDRKWTVRTCNQSGDINTLGDFQAYGSRRSALKGLLEYFKTL